MDASTMDSSVYIHVLPPHSSKSTDMQFLGSQVPIHTSAARKRDEAKVDKGNLDLPDDSDRDAIAIRLSGTGQQDNVRAKGIHGKDGLTGTVTPTYSNRRDSQQLPGYHNNALYRDTQRQPDTQHPPDEYLAENRYHDQSMPASPLSKILPAPGESSIIRSPEGDGNKAKKKSHARKQPAGHIPRPRNAFILFRKHITDNNLIPTSVEVKHQNVSVIASKMWAEAPREVKTEFVEAARKEKEEHARTYPNYRYQPAYRRTDIIRRRVRKDPNEEEKCDAVASLLMEGKVGRKLETEMVKVISTPEPTTSASVASKRGRRRKDAPSELSKGALRAARSQARVKALRENWLESTVFAAHQHQQAMQDEQDQLHFMHQQHLLQQQMQQQQMQRNMNHFHYENGAIYPREDVVGTHDYQDPYHPRFTVQDFGQGARSMVPYPGEYGMVYKPEVHPMTGQPQDNGLLTRSPLDQVFSDPGFQPGSRGPPQQSRGPHPIPIHLDPMLRPPEVHAYGTPILQQMRWDGQPHSLPLQPGPFQAQEPLISPQSTQTPNIPSFQQQSGVELSHPLQSPGTNYFREGYACMPRPRDIITSNWEGLGVAGPSMPPYRAIRSHKPVEDTPTAELLPFLEAEEEVGPSHDIDFGDKGELFGGLLGGKKPGEVVETTEGLYDYQQALKQQEEMEFGLQRF